MLVLILILLVGPCSSDAPEDLFCDSVEECGVGGAGGGGGSAVTGGTGGTGGDGGDGSDPSVSSATSGSSASSSGTGNDGGSGGAGGVGGGGGLEPGPQCRTAADCNSVNNDCRWATCEDGWCGVDFAEFGVPQPDDVLNDCKAVVCNGRGGRSHVPWTDDWPDDRNECTLDSCDENGTAVHVPKERGTPCSTGFCSAGGTCVECTSNADCGTGKRCTLSNGVAKCVDA